jgi:predicted Zn finger-like uncharacterized protein
MEVELGMSEGFFMCAPIGGRSGPVGAHPQKEGHCSNAGGLSAVRRKQLYSSRLYSSRRLCVLARKESPQRILSVSRRFPEPCGRAGRQPSPKHIHGGPMKDVASNSSTSSAYVTPATCPTCRSSAIVTKAKSPDADTYWRCTKCGEIWHASRTVTERQRAYRWR